MDTTAQITLGRLDMYSGEEEISISLQVDNQLHSLGEVRKPSRILKSDARYTCMIPIEAVPQRLQDLIFAAYYDKKSVLLIVGETSVHGKLDGVAGPAIASGRGLPHTTVPDIFSFFVQTEKSKVPV